MKTIGLIFSIVILFSIGVLAQNTDKPPKLETSQTLDNRTYENTLEAKRMIIVPKNTVIIDTLKNVDTILVYNKGQFANLQFVITDTSSTTIDSVIVERYDTASATWGQSTGLKDLSSGTIVSDTMVISAGQTKSYQVNEINPFTYRLRRINTITGRTWVSIWRKE